MVVGLLCVALLSFIILRRLRAKHDNPKYVPTKWLKRRWRLWTPPPVRKRYSNTWQNRRSVQEARRTPSPTSTLRALRGSTSHELSTPERSRERVNNSPTPNQNEPDRRTSVRSVMTLPSYTEDARTTEKIIGREGERSGIDTVVEFPETGDEVEARREEEMESLYQIRVARRTERADREERRRLRREARARGDHEVLDQLRQQARRRAESGSSLREVDSTSAALMQEHQSRDRGRRVSSVSYADLGVARHDGSRVRADSNESDNRPLLDSAASMGSRQPRSAFRNHFANQSTSSLRFQTTASDYSDDERGSSEYEFVPTPWSSSSRRQSLSPVRRSTSAATGDLGDEPMMHPEPPQYEESIAPSSISLRRHTSNQTQPTAEQAPPYESPISPSAPTLPGIAPLPAIEITPFSPVSPAADYDSDSGRTERRL